ncbi:MAG: division/cell wall cluster transcriptional repressor MraZ [Euzebya sp.]
MFVASSVAEVKKNGVVWLTGGSWWGTVVEKGRDVEDFDTDEDEFLGTFMHSLDTKGRLVLPSEHRALLEEGRLVMTLGFDGNMVIHPVADWRVMRDSLGEMQRGNREQRRIARAIYGHASKQVMDRQGRVTVTQKLRTTCNLMKDVAVVGMGDHIEVWPAEAWGDEEGASVETYTSTRDSVGIGKL